MKNLHYLVFVALAFVSWGLYGPVLREGQHLLGTPSAPSSLRSLICVGIAYFLIAVIVPLYVLYSRGEPGKWSLGGFVWSFVAGALGALGALGVVLAFKFHGDPVFVMPLIFGGAPVVNTLVTMALARNLREASLLFYLGVIVVAIGAAGVLFFKPMRSSASHGHVSSPVRMMASTEFGNTAHVTFTRVGIGLQSHRVVQDPPETQDGDPSPAPAAGQPTSDTKPAPQPVQNSPIMVFLSVILTALCWGTYGPILHWGQARMENSRMRPFLCVGLAYFVLAVVLPILLLPTFPEGESISWWGGVMWSLLGGTAGALGALGIIYAFNAGGKPMFVMPLVFGLAPVVNTFAEIVSRQLYGQISPYFFVSLGLVILGAVTVLVCAPRAKPKAETAH